MELTGNDDGPAVVDSQEGNPESTICTQSAELH